MTHNVSTSRLTAKFCKYASAQGDHAAVPGEGLPSRDRPGQQEHGPAGLSGASACLLPLTGVEASSMFQMPGLRVSCRQCSAFRSHNAHLSEGVPSRCIRWWSSTWRSAPCLQQSRQCSTSSRPTRPSLPPPEHRHLPPGQQPRHQVPPCGRSLAWKRPNESCSLLIMRCLAAGLLRSTIVSDGSLGAHAPGVVQRRKRGPQTSLHGLNNKQYIPLWAHMTCRPMHGTQALLQQADHTMKLRTEQRDDLMLV